MKNKKPEVKLGSNRRIKPLDSKVKDIKMARNIIRWFEMTRDKNDQGHPKEHSQ